MSRRPSVSVSDECYSQLQMLSKQRGMSMGDLVTSALNEAERIRIKRVVDRLCEEAWPRTEQP